MKKKVLPVLVVLALILIISGIALLANLIKKYSPSKERSDYASHYHINDPSEILIMQDGEDLDFRATNIDGSIYLDYQYVHDCLNSRFYWDSNENLLLYTTPNSVITVNADSSEYLSNKDTKDFGKTILSTADEKIWIHIDFVKEFTNFTYDSFENPNRLVVTSKFGEIHTATAKKSTYVRELGGIKSPILSDVKKKDTLTVLEEGDKWTKVMTADGFIGYIKSSTLSDITTDTVSSDFEEESFSHIKKDFQICLGWDAIYSTAANNNIANTLARSKNLNVISPTWFYVNDNDGNLHDRASSSYVSFCHSKGVEVWALVSNFENKDVDTTYILTHTSVRNNLVNQIVSAAIQYDLDGINLDFESISSDVGDAYIQFVRELSIKLENNGIVLSIDNYVPSNYTAFYNRKEQALFADYIIVMAYDQHYAGSEESGSVAALDWVQEGVQNTLAEVPADQLVLAMPFYTRLWCLTPQGDSDDESSDTMYQVTSHALGMAEADQLIQQKGAEKTWLSDAGQFYASYEENGNKYEIWLEDSDSLEERLKVMKESKLAGCAFWRLGFEQSSIWDTVAKYF